MKHTITSARWANDEHTAAVIKTRQVGEKAISKIDTPEVWARFLEWAAKPKNKVKDPVPIEPVVTPEERVLAALQATGAVTEVQAKAAAKHLRGEN